MGKQVPTAAVECKQENAQSSEAVVSTAQKIENAKKTNDALKLLFAKLQKDHRSAQNTNMELAKQDVLLASLAQKGLLPSIKPKGSAGASSAAVGKTSVLPQIGSVTADDTTVVGQAGPDPKSMETLDAAADAQNGIAERGTNGPMAGAASTALRRGDASGAMIARMRTPRRVAAAPAKSENPCDTILDAPAAPTLPRGTDVPNRPRRFRSVSVSQRAGHPRSETTNVTLHAPNVAAPRPPAGPRSSFHRRTSFGNGGGAVRPPSATSVRSLSSNGRGTFADQAEDESQVVEEDFDVLQEP